MKCEGAVLWDENDTARNKSAYRVKNIDLSYTHYRRNGDVLLAASRSKVQTFYHNGRVRNDIRMNSSLLDLADCEFVLPHSVQRTDYYKSGKVAMQPDEDSTMVYDKKGRITRVDKNKIHQTFYRNGNTAYLIKGDSMFYFDKYDNCKLSAVADTFYYWKKGKKIEKLVLKSTGNEFRDTELDIEDLIHTTAQIKIYDDPTVYVSHHKRKLFNRVRNAPIEELRYTYSGRYEDDVLSKDNMWTGEILLRLRMDYEDFESLPLTPSPVGESRCFRKYFYRW